MSIALRSCARVPGAPEVSDQDLLDRPLVDWLGMRRSDAELRVAISDNAFEAIPETKKGPGTQWRAASPGLWREHMNPEERRAIEEVIGPKLVELGYDA